MASTNAMDVEKRLKTLRKKLKQIEDLKNKSSRLDPEAQKKVDSEQEIKSEIAALESNGEGGLVNVIQNRGNGEVSLLEEIEAVVLDVSSQAALLLGESA